MDQSLKQLFLQTTSPNGSIRNNAENQLKSLEKNVEFLNYVKNVLMKDQDKILQQISSIYFMNTIEKNWNELELASVVSDLTGNILNLMLIEDKYPKLAYQKILHCIFENSDKNIVHKIFVESSNYLNSNELSKNMVALTLYEEVFKSDGLKFGLDDIFDVMFNQMGVVFTNKLTEFISIKKYTQAGICMKIVAKAYSHYLLPAYLNSVEVFTGYLNLSIQILIGKGIKDDGYLKLQKWAAFFLYKSANKGIKKYFKNNDFVVFIRNEETLKTIYNTFVKLVNDYISQSPIHERIPIICADFFTAVASNKRSRIYIKDNYMFLISSFILPSQSYNEDMKDKFEDDADAYLRERYNYFTSDLRSATSELFEEIFHCDKEIEMKILTSLRGFLDGQLNDSNAPMRYGIIGLLANTQKSLSRSLISEEFHQFLVCYIFPNLVSPYPYLISQSLFFLSLTETIEILDNNTYEVLNTIFSLISGSNEVLSVEACLSLNAFFYNDLLHNTFKTSIPSLFEKVLYYTKKYFLESLSTLCDSIIDCFTDDITAYAPLFVQSICSSFMDNIESEKDEKISAIAGCLNTIQKLIMAADDKPEIVSNIYQYTSVIIYYIANHKKANFYQESFDIMNSFLYSLRNVNESMFEIFTLFLSIESDELCLYPREICDFIDNYLTYGRDQMINIKTLGLIYRAIDTIMPINSAECEIYDEDFEAACRIIDSLMLNCGNIAHRSSPNLISDIIHKIVSNYEFANTYDSLPVYALNSIMNCFIVSPDTTILNLGTFIETFFNELDTHKKKMIRVYDKKLFLLFSGTLFKISANLSINYEIFCGLFVHMLSTLPDAIKKRNQLKDKENNDDEDIEEDYSDYTAEDIYEDIYFETILDKFDAYEFTRNMLGSISSNSIGEKTVSMMTSVQISKIKEILEVPQEVQK